MAPIKIIYTPYRGDGLNLYAYCKNNPVAYYDPSGYMLCSGGKTNPAEDGKKTTGETSATATGKEVHKDKADARRASGEYDTVNQKLTDSNGDIIEVPKTVRKDNQSVSTKTQAAMPDAVQGPDKGGIIYDDKPYGRDVRSKDYQEMGRNVEAYKQKYGVEPNAVVIEYYDPKTGLDVDVEIIDPSVFNRYKQKTKK